MPHLGMLASKEMADRCHVRISLTAAKLTVPAPDLAASTAAASWRFTSQALSLGARKYACDALAASSCRADFAGHEAMRGCGVQGSIILVCASYVLHDCQSALAFEGLLASAMAR